jgi:CheY-like chemotaxis protein
MPADPIGSGTTTDGLGTSPHSPEDARPTILVADARSINRDFLVRLLEYSGYERVEARSLTESPTVDHLDLIITDIQMPDTDGLTFLDAVRAQPASRLLPVVLCMAGYKTKKLTNSPKPTVYSRFLPSHRPRNDSGARACGPQVKFSEEFPCNSSSATQRIHAGRRPSPLSSARCSQSD